MHSSGDNGNNDMSNSQCKKSLKSIRIDGQAHSNEESHKVKQIGLKKHLIVFDFDQTMVEGESFFEMVKLIPEWSEEDTQNLFAKVGNWFLFVEEIMKYLIESKISAQAIKENFKKLQLTENFADLLKFLFWNKDYFDIHIISGTYDIFVKWILDHHGMLHIIDEIHCEKAIVEDDFVKFIMPLKYEKCQECNFCICKAISIQKILKNNSDYETMHYVGDGLNDICPALLLDTKDFLYPRRNYKLYKKIFEENYESKINSKIISWENGMNILDNIKALFLRQNYEADAPASA